MEYIELVIKIPKAYYELVLERCKDPVLLNAFKNGILLPKGHGELKDMGNFQYIFDLTREDHIYSGKDIERAVKSMKSIVEADKAESESKDGEKEKG